MHGPMNIKFVLNNIALVTHMRDDYDDN